MVDIFSIALLSGYTMLVSWLINQNPGSELPRTIREEMYRINL